MGELPTALPEKEVYNDLIEQSTTPEDIVALREMAQSDLAKVSITSESGQTSEVTNIGTEKFSELTTVDPEALKAAQAVNSDTWVKNDH